MIDKTQPSVSIIKLFFIVANNGLNLWEFLYFLFEHDYCLFRLGIFRILFVASEIFFFVYDPKTLFFEHKLAEIWKFSLHRFDFMIFNFIIIRNF